MDQPWTASVDDVLAELESSLDEGLSAEVARRRLREHGPNRLQRHQRRPWWRIVVDQFKSTVVLFLVAAAVAAAAFGREVEAIAIAAAVVVNTIIGFAMEWRANRSMEALRRMGAAEARVRRAGSEQVIEAARLVPGDVCPLEPGHVVPADLRLAETNRLRCDEASLTGESEAVAKEAEGTLAADTAIGDRSNMAWKGTAVVDGSGLGIVVRTGTDTELGRISELVESAEPEATPLEKRIGRLGHLLVWGTLGVAVLIALAGIAAGKDLMVMVETSIALAIAAVPEGLPIVATLALAQGMRRMARRNALVKRLAAVEALGAVNVILTDKTGTLTEDRMTLRCLALAGTTIELEPAGDDGMEARVDDERADLDELPAARVALEIGALCTNAGYEDGEPVGDPTEVALLAAAQALHRSREALVEEQPEEREESFDPEMKMMATYHRVDDGLRVAVKGAPEAVLEHCSRVHEGEGEAGLDDAGRSEWAERADTLAGRGLRVLALAQKTVGEAGAEPYADLTLVALAGLYDPPRGDIDESIAACQRAGIRVVMVTGDHLVTARAIAAEIGLAAADAPAMEAGEMGDADQGNLLEQAVFARISPEQKLDLVDAYQDAGNIVGMTGDGVNDAPALKKADIGVAMGRRGTEVARETADIVLLDDAFSTIVAAIEHGRTIFVNIRRFIVYLLSGNLAEIMAVSLAAALGAPLPLLPLQILYINFVSDVMPALALGLVPGTADALERPPRAAGEPLMTGRHWAAVAAWGALVAATVLAAFWFALEPLGLDPGVAVTLSFLCFGFTRLWHVFNMRSRRGGVIGNAVVRSPVVWGAIGIGIVLLLAAVWVPGLNTVLGTQVPTARGWLLLLGFSLVPLLVGQALVAAGWLGPERGLGRPQD